MPERSTSDPRAAHRRLAEFRRAVRAGTTAERLFVEPTVHPAEPTGFCWCDGSVFHALRFWLKAVLLGLPFLFPWNPLKLWALRRAGARVGRRVYFSHGAWVDPVFPDLIAIEDRVFFGTGARIYTHEFRVDSFRAGRVTVRAGAFIGAHAVLAPGVEIGPGAVVAAFTVADRDVPAGATLIAAPSRIVKRGEP